jgi:large subunit ribosomal protein L21e
MPHSFGLRARTRNLFSRPYRQHGPIPLAKYLTTYKIGDIVDIKANGAIHKGMPYRYYHGKTGVVWNVGKRSIGVEINKQVRTRIVKKKLTVRVEHVQKSRCREDFLRRVRENEKARAKAKQQGKKISLKRLPAQPREGKLVKAKNIPIQTIAPIKWEDLF